MIGLTTAGRRRTIAVLVACAIGVALAFEPLLLGREWYFRDLFMLVLPQKEHQVELLKQGLVAWWDPWLNGGQPSIANPNSLALHPVLLLYALASPGVALAVTVAGGAAAAMVATERLASRMGAGSAASLLAAVSFGTSGFVASCVSMQHLFLGLCALPVLIAFLDSHLRSGRMRPLGGAMLCGGWIALGGMLEPALVAAATGAAWAFLAPSAAPWRRRLTALGAIASGAIALAAVQALPAMYVLARSRRAAGLGSDWILSWSVHPRRLPELFVPGFLGRLDTLDPLDRWSGGLEHPSFPYLLTLHLGALPLLLAVAGAFGTGDRAPRRLRTGLALLVGAGVIVSLGRHLPFASSLDAALPVRFPVKALLLLPLPVAVLAALGLEEMRRRTRTALAVAAAAGVLALALGGLSLACATSASAMQPALRSWFADDTSHAPPLLAAGFGIAAAQAALAALLPLLGRRASALVAAPALVAVTGLSVFWSVNPAIDPSLLEGIPPAARIVLEERQGGRLYADRGEPDFRLRAPENLDVYQARWLLASLSDSHAFRYGIPVIFHPDYDGLVPLPLARMTDAVAAASWPRRLPLLAAAGVTIVASNARLDVPGLDPFAVVPVDSDLPLRLYRVRAAAPVVRFVQRAVRAPDPAEALELLASGSDPRSAVILVVDADPIGSPDGCSGSVHPSSLGDHADWSGIVDAECAGWLVVALPEHAGTTLSVDGVGVKPLLADGAFMAVPVPAGRHEVAWRYRPRGFVPGAAISLAALAILVAVMARRPAGDVAPAATPDAS